MSVPIHRLTALAETCVFAKQSGEPFHCAPDGSGDPFLRTYGAKLPSSLMGFISNALPYSGSLPVSDYGTNSQEEFTRLFLAVSFNGFAFAVAQARPAEAGTETSNTPTILPSASPCKLTFLARAGILTGYPSPTPVNQDLA